MPDFMREDQEALARMVEQASAANEQFDRLAATLSGPLAEAELDHQQNLQRMTELGIEAGRSTSEIDALKKAETERYNEQRLAIEATLNPMEQLLAAQQAELGMLGMGNTEREMMNALRAQGIDLLGDEARFRPPRVRDIAGALEVPETEIRRLLKLAARLGRVDQIARTPPHTTS